MKGLRYMILAVDKPKNMTSRDVVNILNKHFKTKKIGHTGTLDPIATGLLICLIDKDTKLVNLLTSKDKEYIATMKLGIKTDTLDITGNIIDKKDFNVNKKQIEDVLKSFIGEIEQVVPIYSAVKIHGKKLYEYARENIDIELPKRKVNIKTIELLDFHDDLITFKTYVSKGTYIRSLINDIAIKLNTYGTMTELRRVKQGIFKIDDANKLEDILENNYSEITYEEVFKDYEKEEIDDITYKKVSNGVKMKEKEVIYTYKGDYIALYGADGRLKILFK